jgi:hypothetical protein
LKSHNKKKGSIGKRLLSFFYSKTLTIMLKNLINKILLGNTQIAGMRTIILNTITLLLAVWDFAIKDGGLFNFLCGIADNFTALAFFCTISESQFYISALVVITALNNVLRWLSDGPVGASGPARLRVGGYEISNTRARIIGGSVGVSIVSIIGMVISGVL